jgi:hypothetical protein
MPLVLSQLIRLHQRDAAGWLACDYLGRCGALAVLAAIPLARQVAFKRDQLRAGAWVAVGWIVGLVIIHRLAYRWLMPAVEAVLPGTRFGDYAAPQGWLLAFDLTFGIALVALTEEVVFRRCLGQLLHTAVRNARVVIPFSAIIFAGYHWWSGIGNIVVAFMSGVLFMTAYTRIGALWPLVIAHYLVDVIELRAWALHK